MFLAHNEILIIICRHSFFSGIIIHSNNLWGKHKSFSCVIWRKRWQSTADSKADSGSRLRSLFFDLTHSLFSLLEPQTWSLVWLSLKNIIIVCGVCICACVLCTLCVCVCVHGETKGWCQVFFSITFHITIIIILIIIIVVAAAVIMRHWTQRFQIWHDWLANKLWSPCCTCLPSARTSDARFHTRAFYVSVEGS